MNDTEIDTLKKLIIKLKNDHQEFVYAVSHDLEAPLRHIDTFSKRLQENNTDNLTGEALEDLDIIRESSLRCKMLIEDLVQYSRVETHFKPATKIDSKAACEEAISQLGTLLNNDDTLNKINLSIDNLPKVAGDFRQLKIVFFELIKNSFIFAKTDTPVSISVSANEDKEYYIFHVIDDGPGIRDRAHKRAFELFQRTTTSKRQGNGTGLALSKRIVERHEGRIWINTDHKENLGTTISFTWPKAGKTFETD